MFVQEVLEGRGDAVGVGELFGRGPDESVVALRDHCSRRRELDGPALHLPFDMGEDVARIGQARDRKGMQAAGREPCFDFFLREMARQVRQLPEAGEQALVRALRQCQRPALVQAKHGLLLDAALCLLALDRQLLL